MLSRSAGPRVQVARVGLVGLRVHDGETEPVALAVGDHGLHDVGRSGGRVHDGDVAVAVQGQRGETRPLVRVLGVTQVARKGQGVVVDPVGEHRRRRAAGELRSSGARRLDRHERGVPVHPLLEVRR